MPNHCVPLSKEQLITMLTMQDNMNSKVHKNWIEQNFEWYRAIWVECAELMDHIGYKWWKKQVSDNEQVNLEIIDIWHFGMSALFKPELSKDVLADYILQDIADAQVDQNALQTDTDVRKAVEALAQSSLETQSFSVNAFVQLMLAANMDFSALYVSYVGKNVLNFFRQDHGYKDGSYQKQWDGKEDNEHLAEIVASLDSSSDEFRDNVYRTLSERYKALAQPA